MIALRILAWILGGCLMWCLTFGLQEWSIPIWSQIRRATFVTFIFLIVFALLQFALAGHL